MSAPEADAARDNAPSAAQLALPPTLSRATSTSALSVVSVESSLQSSPRRLLSSRTLAALPQLVAHDGGLVKAAEGSATGTPSSSRPSSLFGLAVGGSPRSTPSRKGKERALPTDLEGGEGAANVEVGAAEALRRMKRGKGGISGPKDGGPGELF